VSPLDAQEARQQGNAAATLAWPSWTDQQRWNRSHFLGIAHWAGLIAYAKARGEGPDQVARFFADRYAPGWGMPQSGVAIRDVRSRRPMESGPAPSRRREGQAGHRAEWGGEGEGLAERERDLVYSRWQRAGGSYGRSTTKRAVFTNDGIVRPLARARLSAQAR